jgi:hypothetical protein
MEGNLVRMASRTKSKLSPAMARVKKRQAKIISARLEEIAEAKRKNPKAPGYTREDLEALRDGRR